MSRDSFNITLSGKHCIHAGPRYGDAYKRANSYRCPVGAQPGRAWVLLTREDCLALASTSPHTLSFISPTSGGVTIRGLYWVKDYRVRPSTSDKGVHLVELADKRILGCRWSDTGKYLANVRGGAIAYTAPYVAGAGETWQDAVDALWPSTLGTAPTLPYSPVGQPEGQYHGENAWFCLHHLLDVIGCTTAYNPTDGTFSIVRRGDSQTISYAATPTYTADPVDNSVIDAPQNVVSYFIDWSEQHGTEAETLTSGSNYLDGPPYATETDAVDSGAPSGTVAPQWAAIPSEADYAGTDQNSAERASWGAQTATSMAQDAATPRALKQYQGAVSSILPGAQVKVVQWRHWGPQQGMVTEYVTHPGDPKDGAGEVDFPQENWVPPDFARAGYPTWPRVCQVVKIDHASTSPGTEVSPTSNLHEGTLVYHSASGTTDAEPVWIRLLDDYYTSSGNINAIQGDQYIGRCAGMAVVSADKRPLYVARKGSGGGGSDLRIGFVTQVGGIANGASGTVEIAVTQSAGSCGDLEQSTSPSTVTACNPVLPTVWAGCTVVVAQIAVAADPDTPGATASNLWYIVSSNAAYRLKGLSAGKFFPDVSSGTCDGLTAIRGYFPDASVTATNRLEKICCDNEPVTLEWDEGLSAWLLEDCKPVPQLRVRAQLNEDSCAQASTIAVKNITALGMACLPDNASATWDNFVGIIGKEDDYVYGTMQLDTGAVEVEAVELKPASTYETKYTATKIYHTKKDYVAPSCEETTDVDVVTFAAQTVGTSISFTDNGDGTGDLDLARSVIYCIAGAPTTDSTVAFNEC